jgi:hypothetical protein
MQEPGKNLNYWLAHATPSTASRWQGDARGVAPGQVKFYDVPVASPENNNFDVKEKSPHEKNNSHADGSCSYDASRPGG